MEATLFCVIVVIYEIKRPLKRWERMGDSLLSVLGFAFIVLGLLFLIRAWGLINKESPFVRYSKLISYALLASGTILLIISFFA
jgi:hypothetical protein